MTLELVGSSDGAGPRLRGEGLSAIADAVVRAMKEHLGKGPTRARAHIVDNHLFVVTQDGFTTVERTLMEADQSYLVREARLQVHQRLAETLRPEIERVTGRPVIGSSSQVVFGPDTDVQIFVLGPSGSPD